MATPSVADLPRYAVSSLIQLEAAEYRVRVTDADDRSVVLFDSGAQSPVSLSAASYGTFILRDNDAGTAPQVSVITSPF